jgi:hypothetical protein
MRADIHDGQEHKRSIHGPNTEAPDQSSPSVTFGLQHTAGPYSWVKCHALIERRAIGGLTAKVEELCAEFLQAVGRDRYSPAEVIQAACNLIAVAITETRDMDLAIQAKRRWIM